MLTRTCSLIAQMQPQARGRKSRRMVAVRASSGEADVFDNAMGKSMLQTFDPTKERLSIAWGGIKNMPVPKSVVRPLRHARTRSRCAWICSRDLPDRPRPANVTTSVPTSRSSMTNRPTPSV